jgi:hypothetical protein
MKTIFTTNLSASKFLMSLLVFSLLGLTQCKREKCEKPCKNGQVNINGNCQCPPNTFWYQGSCKEKHESIYYIDSSDCQCFKDWSSFNFQFGWNRLFTQIKNNNLIDNAYPLGAAFNYKGAGAWLEGSYFMQKDSLHIQDFLWTSLSVDLPLSCDYKKAFAIGKVFDIDRKIKLKIYFHDEDDHLGWGTIDNSIGNCTMWLNNHTQ